MAHLIVQIPGSPNQTVPLVKSMLTLGGPDADVLLPDARGLVTIERDGTRFTASALDGAAMMVSGKRRDLHALAEGDELALGNARIVFKSEERARELAHKVTPQDSSALLVQRLADLAAQLAREPSLDKALTSILDAIIEVVRADKGFLLVVESGQPRVQTARNFRQQDITNAVERLSDSIVSKVLQTRQPIIVSDAGNDTEFNVSASVVNLKLTSVLCAPLIRRGELIGAVYVANDSVRALFGESDLTLVSAFCTNAALLLELALERDELKAQKKELETRLEEQTYGDILGSCEAMKDIFRKIDKVAATDISVLVTGETGTGKELIARELHRRSGRKNGPFIAINCGAIPENLLESELFGHVKGAFTGAIATRIGRFQAANGGTLFLDEVGDMPAPLQVKLLRALQDRTVIKVGDTRQETIDIRVVAATNKSLDEEMRANRFREDLYYRINVVALHLPALRERGEDAVLLARWFLARSVRELGSKEKSFSKQAIAAIKNYRWPGNIRQLENRIKKAVVLAEGEKISPDDLDLKPEQLDPILPLALAQDTFRTQYINDVLDRNGGNRTKTAKDLGVDPRTIFRHLERMEAEKSGSPMPADGFDGGEGSP
jgi:transcriptional regulator with GAF, ATPase, and Fis domain